MDALECFAFEILKDSIRVLRYCSSDFFSYNKADADATGIRDKEFDYNGVNTYFSKR